MAEAPDPDDPNIFFKSPHPLSRDISFDEQKLEGEEKEVAEQTQKIFRTFLFTRLTSDIERESEDGDLTVAEISPNLLHNIRDEKSNIEKMEQDPEDQKIVQIGRMLADVGDEVNEKYQDDFSTMVSTLALDEEFAFDTFANVARKLFNNGINWGRIIALFLFGYEIASSFIRRSCTFGVKSFLRKILKYMVSFVFKENIVNWIIEQGGWLKFKLQESDNWIYGIGAVLLTIFAGYGVYKLTRGDNS